MGSKLRNCLWCSSLLTNVNMYKLMFCLSVVAALPLEDTVEVQQARSNFLTAFAAAEAGDHAKLAPVNNDIQAAQIATAYLADTEDVIQARADFDAEFKNVEAGGLMDLQAPAPVAPAAPAPVAMVASHIPYYNIYHHNLVQPPTQLSYNALSPATYTALHPATYSALHPINYAATFPYALPVQHLPAVKTVTE